jgi:hypothetical protein
VTSRKPSGRRRDGSHWQADKTHCNHGHDIRYVVDGEPNPNVKQHPISGTRQCLTCSRLRARLAMRVLWATRRWREHTGNCPICRMGHECETGYSLALAMARHYMEMRKAGFGRRVQEVA